MFVYTSASRVIIIALHRALVDILMKRLKILWDINEFLTLDIGEQGTK